MTATPSGPDFFPIGSYCHTALVPTRHRNKHKHALQTDGDGEEEREYRGDTKWDERCPCILKFYKRQTLQPGGSPRLTER